MDDRLSAGDSPPITGGYAGHDRKGLYYVKFLLVVVDLYDPLPDNVLTSVAERTGSPHLCLSFAGRYSVSAAHSVDSWEAGGL